MTNKATWQSSRSMSSAEPTAGCSPTVPEPELYRSIQAVLPAESDMDPDCLKKGMLRWTLHKKVQISPESNISLVWLLIKELEKTEKWDSRQCIIPLLHTLMYAIIQTAYIPDELYKRVYNFCKRLLTYPLPYCTVGLSYTKQIKTERSIPGLQNNLFKELQQLNQWHLQTRSAVHATHDMDGAEQAGEQDDNEDNDWLMYQRMLTGEQRLKNDHYPFQERVFVLADPDIFSGSMGEFLLGDIEDYSSASGGSLGPLDHMRNVVQHSIQAALGAEHCHGQRLAQALKDKGSQEVETYFQEVLAMVEQSMEEGGREEGAALRSRLQELYSKIFADTDSEPLSGGPLCNCPLPNPEMSFQLWKEDLDIWRELARWLRSSSASDQSSLSLEQEDLELGESPTDPVASDMARFSVLSNDSGIERDLPPSADPPSSSLENTRMIGSWEECKSHPSPSPSESDLSKLSRRGGFKMKLTVKDTVMLMQDTFEDPTGRAAGGGGGNGGRGETRGATLQRRAGSSMMQSPFPKQERPFTARIVAMGDDRVLGRLAKEYYFYRKREARRLFLTMKINLQFYYIPVSRATMTVRETLNDSMGNTCTLGSYLSMVDPWYKINIKSLGSMIPKLAEMQQANPGKPKDPFVSDVISYYIRTSQQPVFFTIYSVKITFTNLTKDPVEDVFLTHLDMHFSELTLTSASIRGGLDKQRKSLKEGSGVVVWINYRKVTLSGRYVDLRTSVRMSSAQINAIPSNQEEDLNCLTLTLNESPAKTKSSIVDSKIRTNSIKMETLESRSLIITLDRDCCRTYKDVESIEIFPCLDPGYCAQKTMRSKLNLGEDRDACLSKYMNKGLPLPMNTFAGIAT